MKVASLILGVVALYAPIGQPDTSPQAFVDWAKPRAIALPADSIGGAHVADVIGKARMVSLGEPAHGAHEPLAFRNRLFRYLVEQHGFTALALESGFNEARVVNDFVLGGAGDPEEIARAGLTWGFGGFAENVELLRWMRAYNADSARRRKVTFYGIDLSGGDNKGGFAKSGVALDDALSYLARGDAKLAARARDAVGPFMDRFTLDKYPTLSAGERKDLLAGIENVAALLDTERRRLIAGSSEEEYEWVVRSVVVAKQLETLFRLSPAEVPDGGVVAEFQQAAAARDAAMADNALWALRREGPAGRVLVFAHNAHIMNAPLRGGIWGVYSQAPPVMGQHLRAALGKELLIIGTSSSSSGRGLPPTPAQATTIDAALADIGLPHFILDLRDSPRASILWLQRIQSMRANFTTEIEVPLPEAFDAIVYFEGLSAAGRDIH